MFQQFFTYRRRNRVRRLSGYAIVLVAFLLTLAAPSARATTACSVTYTISPQNSNAFGAGLTINNTGTTAWTSWTLTWTFADGQTISNGNLWNGIASQSGANVTVTNQNYNGSIAAGGSYTGVGFNGTWNGTTNTVPTNFAVNGTSCGGGGGSSPTATTTTLSSSTTSTTTGASVTLTAAVSPSAATGTVTFYDGTTSLGTGTISSGTATLSTSFSTAGTHSITAVYAGSSTYATSTSSAVSITVSALTSTTTTLSSSTTTPKAGASFTLTATVSPSAATGTVTFYNGTTSLGTGTLSSGVATLSTSLSTAGTYSITAVYGGSSTYATSTSSAVSISVTSSSTTATTTTLSSSTTSTTTGSSVTLTAAVSPSAATGTVTFYDGSISLGTGTLSSGAATLSTSFSTTGTHSITAVYAGSSTYATSTSSAVSITVSSSTSYCSVTYTISPQNSNAFGAALTINNTSSTAWTSWTLTWTFANGQTVSSLWNGIASQSGANVTVANESYNGSIAAGGSSTGIGFNGAWNGTTNAVPTNFAVNGTSCGGGGGSSPTATTTTLSSSTTSTTTGTSVTLTAAVSPTAATGTVTFYDGSTSLGTGTISSGKATLSTSFSTAGTHSITAVYAGSSTYATSTSSAVSITVSALTSTTTTLSSSTTSTTTGTSVTLTAAVSPSAATGTVTFYDGSTLLGTGTLSSGTATLSTSFSTAGTYSITAVYAGSSTYATSTSSAVSISVTSSSTTATTTTLSSSTASTTTGASVTLTVAVSPSAATGTVTFYNGSTLLGTGTISSGTATLSTSFSTAGTYSITAVYAGSSTYATSTSSAVSITVTGTSSYTTFQQHFVDLYTDIHNTSNGYFNSSTTNPIPYHSVETLMAEAPDYGHETVSETYSYWIWLEALYGGLTKDWTPLQTAWTSLETNMIPTADDQPTNSSYTPSSPATYAPEGDSPSDYPATLTTSVSRGSDPLFSQLSATYGNDNIYGMHWIIDTDNWYGYGQKEDGASKPSYINTFQRGANEGVFLTVPQPCWDNFKFGNTSSGYLSLFTSGPWSQQWKYTTAPDADARAVQAIYWADQFATAQGGSSTVTGLVAKASKLGDYLRYAMFDKYFKTMGCTSTSCQAGTGYNAAHYLLSWYYAWGGSLSTSGSWAWRIGDGAAHFGYQNPVAAYALSSASDFTANLPTQTQTDWSTSLERQIELYRWLQSDEGAIAGGATNSWDGQYATPPTGDPTFYGLAYDWEPVYHDPPSNQWFGMQVWSMERFAEYYYITGDSKAKVVLDPWIKWVEGVTTVNADGSFTVPGSLCWNNSPGQSTAVYNDTTCPYVAGTTLNAPSLNWNATTQDWTTVPLNPNLHVTVVGTATDIGEAGSLAKALSYYSAGVGKWTGTNDATSEALAKNLLTGIWTKYRDTIGISVTETRADYIGFGDAVYIPSGWTGTMPSGDPINSSSTFISLRTQYKNDTNWPQVEAYLNGTGPAPTFNYHRFWAQVDIASAYEVFANLFPGN